VRLEGERVVGGYVLDDDHDLGVDVRDSRVAALRLLDASRRKRAYATVQPRPAS
jgi:hypothetical protein